MRGLVVVSVAGFGGFSALLSVAPLWVTRGGAGSAGAGLVTGVMLLATILTQGFVPGLLRRFGDGAVLAAGLLLLGLPALAYGLSDQLAPVLSLSALRGVGFGVLTVTGSTVVAELFPVVRRGEAVGVYGLAVALPNLAVLPASVAIVDRLGFWPAFWLGALPVLGVPAALHLGRAVAGHRDREPSGGPAGVSEGGAAIARGGVLLRLAPPALVLFAVTLAGGGLVTFLPQVIASGGVAATALLVLGLFSALSRWWIGRRADRGGARRLLVPLLLLTSVGLLLTALSVERHGSTWLLETSVAVIGIGYGALQNLTLVAAFERVQPQQYGSASAVWNIGFDAGTGVGAVLVGWVASVSSFPTAFVVLAGLTLAATPLAVGRPAGSS